MSKLPQQDRAWQSADLPPGWTREDKDSYVLEERGRTRHYRRVPRRNVGHLTEQERDTAIIIRRDRSARVPRTLPGFAVREVLEPLGSWSYDDVARKVAHVAAGDPDGFIARAVKDKDARLTILVRTDER